MQSRSPEVLRLINDSLECIARAGQASDKASRLQETSRKLRERAAELRAYNLAMKKNSLTGKLRLHDHPDLIMATATWKSIVLRVF